MAGYDGTDETTEWLNYLQPEGLVLGPNVLRQHGLTPIRQTPLDTEETIAALGLDADAPRSADQSFILADPWGFFERVLEWPARLVAGAPGGPPVPVDLTKTLPEHTTLLSPDMALMWNGAAEGGVPAQALVLLHPRLDPDARNQFGEDEWEASPHQRLERLLRETGVGCGILVARNTLRLVYAPRGETAGWISWPLAALGRVDGRPMLAGLKLALGKYAFFVGPENQRLRPLLKESRDAQNEVSEKLSSQVLEALHELLRGLHRAAPDRIEALAEQDAHHLYEGLLTCLMRLVFLLYAEDRDLLPTYKDGGLKPLWESGYSIKTLYSRLLADEAVNPDTMDERRGAWGQLLAVFRIIHVGATDWVAARGGKLFDPDAFPFLEGRDKTRLQDLLRGRDADDFVHAAAAFASGDRNQGLREMKSILKRSDNAKWTVVTYLPFLWRPDTNVFLKPTMIQNFATRVGHRFADDYSPELDLKVYESLLDLAEEVKQKVTDLEPRDMIDVQSFMWTSVEYREEDREDYETAGN